MAEEIVKKLIISESINYKKTQKMAKKWEFLEKIFFAFFWYQNSFFVKIS